MRAHLEVFEHVRAKLGFEVELLHDIHERLVPIDAVGFAKEMEKFKLFFLEDPLAPEDIDWFHNIRSRNSTVCTAQPVSAWVSDSIAPSVPLRRR